MKHCILILLFSLAILGCKSKTNENEHEIINYGGRDLFIKSIKLPQENYRLETTYFKLTDTLVNGYLKKFNEKDDLILFGSMINSDFVGNVYVYQDNIIVFSQFIGLNGKVKYQTDYDNINKNRKWNKRSPDFSFVPNGLKLLIDVYSPYYGEDERKLKITDDKGVELVNEVCVDPYNSIKIPYDDRTYIAELIYIKDGEVKLVDTTKMEYLKSMLEENESKDD